MNAPRKPNLIASIIAVVLLLLIGGYVGAYDAMVIPMGRVTRPTFDAWYGVPFGTSLETTAGITDWATPLFAPAHWLDRRIRPQV